MVGVPFDPGAPLETSPIVPENDNELHGPPLDELNDRTGCRSEFSPIDRGGIPTVTPEQAQQLLDGSVVLRKKTPK